MAAINPSRLGHILGTQTAFSVLVPLLWKLALFSTSKHLACTNFGIRENIFNSVWHTGILGCYRLCLDTICFYYFIWSTYLRSFSIVLCLMFGSAWRNLASEVLCKYCNSNPVILNENTQFILWKEPAWSKTELKEDPKHFKHRQAARDRMNNRGWRTNAISQSATLQQW